MRNYVNEWVFVKKSDTIPTEKCIYVFIIAFDKKHLTDETAVAYSGKRPSISTLFNCRESVTVKEKKGST